MKGLIITWFILDVLFKFITGLLLLLITGASLKAEERARK